MKIPGQLSVEINSLVESGDFEAVDPEILDGCDLLYLCSPNNPTGAVLDLKTLGRLIELAHRHDFVIAADECYSEIYLDESAPPPSLLEASAACGNPGYARCVVFHSLSKRSNLPGLRSGFVAGDAALLARYYDYRTYAGGAMAMALGQVDPDSMVNWTVSGELVFITIMSGPGSVIAPFIGAIVFEFIRTYAFELAPQAWQLIVGGTLLAIIFFLPGGIWSLIEKPWAKGDAKNG